MPGYSQKSLKQLYGCHPQLQLLFFEIIKHYDCTVLEGYRNEMRQDELYRIGQSKVKYPDSKHNTTPSMAVDVAPYPIDWNNTKRFYHFAGFVIATAKQLSLDIRWGGDWDSDNDLDDQMFMDLVHFELRIKDV